MTQSVCAIIDTVLLYMIYYNNACIINKRNILIQKGIILIYSLPEKPYLYKFDFPPGTFDTGIVLYSAGGIAKEEKEAEFALLPCEGFVFSAVMSGGIAMLSEGKNQQVGASHAMLLRLKENAPCLFRIESLTEAVFIVFGGVVCENIIAQFPRRVFAPFPIYSAMAPLYNLNAIVSDAQNKMIVHPYQGAGHVYTLLCELCRWLAHDTAAHKNSLVEQAVGMIRDRYAYLYGVEDMAESIGVTKHHLIREFTRSMGLSPGRFLTQTRISHAKSLLAYSDYSVELVGQMVGYANGNYFCKAFKRQTGRTPKEFRQQNFSGHNVIPQSMFDAEMCFLDGMRAGE